MTRLLNRQKQLAEQGRLRLGMVVEARNGKTRPVASDTWIVTSHERLYVETAAQLWGGEVERWQPQGHGVEQWRVQTAAVAIDAILPTGDPLTQAYEMWSAGGCQRRCDGVTEQFSGSPCICVSQFGEEWYEQPAGQVCTTVTRLKVILPDMPGIGAWRVETGSFYAADEIAGMIEVIRATVGDHALIPIQLRVEQRTSTRRGQTRQFIVPVVELRGVTARALIANAGEGVVQAVEAAKQAAVAGGQPQKAIGGNQTAPIRTNDTPEYYLELARQARTLPELQRIWGFAARSGIPQAHGLWDQLKAIANHLDIGQGADAAARQTTSTAADAPPPQAAQPAGPTREQLWYEILRISGELELPLDQVQAEFMAINEGMHPTTADAAQMQRYLDHLNQVAAQ